LYRTSSKAGLSHGQSASADTCREASVLREAIKGTLHYTAHISNKDGAILPE